MGRKESNQSLHHRLHNYLRDENFFTSFVEVYQQMKPIFRSLTYIIHQIIESVFVLNPQWLYGKQVDINNKILYNLKNQ